MGKRTRKHKRGFKTKKEAQLWTSNVQVDYEKQGYISNDDITFEQLYDKWFLDYKQSVKESTWAKTADIFRLHIIPVLGSTKIKGLTVPQCQKVVQDWFNAGFKHYRRFRSSAVAILNYGVRMELITRNPMAKTSIPKRKDVLETPTFDFYEKTELIKYLNAAYQYDEMAPFTFFRLLAFTGMRKGEALALQWSDIDFKTNEISISKTESKGNGGRLLVQTPKTKTSLRTIKVDAKTMHWLHKWHLNQASLYLELGYNTHGTSQLVFSNQYNELLQPSVPEHWNQSICKKYDLRHIKIHAFRHTFCTLAFAAGVSLMEVSKTLGHANLNITQQVYLHVTEQQKADVAAKLDQFMSI
ncbi:prophage lp4 protein 1, integrase [Lactiplantibacillus xiangfangensis]|uniref:Prophage lp4 protein 1, integrase n=2 Tax=Lactiplantibacillus xiangfangensis TaxID=942150 RepID=A0A0R2M7F1_9LACO|nr:prophage lp4 protein 1, integrase [Lactiplantibacillus xiangfangensis]